MHERANGLRAQDDFIPDFDMLEARGERAVLNLDGIEF